MAYSGCADGGIKQTVCRLKLPSGNICGELGHTSATCPHRPCDLCGLLSNPRHTKRNCPSRKTGVRHCRTCGQPGHQYGPNCPSYQPPWRVPDNEVPYLARLPLSMDMIGFSGPRHARRINLPERSTYLHGGVFTGTEAHEGTFSVSERLREGRRKDFGQKRAFRCCCNGAGMCKWCGIEGPSGYAIVGGEPQLARSYDGELNTITGEPIVHSMVVYYGRQRKKPKVGMF